MQGALNAVREINDFGATDTINTNAAVVIWTYPHASNFGPR